MTPRRARPDAAHANRDPVAVVQPAGRAPTRRVRARHEAGHCVVALAMGWRPRKADIADAEAQGGQSLYFPRPRYCSRSAEERRRRVSVLFGGLEAERRVSRASLFALLTTGGAADAERIRDTLDQSYGPWQDAPEPVRALRDREEEACRCNARSVVRRHWRAVEALTRALLSRGALDSRSIFGIAIHGSRSLGTEFRRARR